MRNVPQTRCPPYAWCAHKMAVYYSGVSSGSLLTAGFGSITQERTVWHSPATCPSRESWRNRLWLGMKDGPWPQFRKARIATDSKIARRRLNLLEAVLGLQNVGPGSDRYIHRILGPHTADRIRTQNRPPSRGNANSGIVSSRFRILWPRNTIAWSIPRGGRDQPLVS